MRLEQLVFERNSPNEILLFIDYIPVLIPAYVFSTAQDEIVVMRLGNILAIVRKIVRV